jgi:hypothetical protein
MGWAMKLTTFSIALSWSAWPQGCSDWREALLGRDGVPPVVES